ncbi:MAG: hypothetical protein DSM106950_20970 [Stigonema ocellatum SAG 48.90 = DSM 106950]|nr:hypothetical protein [Stigonema ocellatum SAG 48.90 = DSM 106950]
MSVYFLTLILRPNIHPGEILQLEFLEPLPKKGRGQRAEGIRKESKEMPSVTGFRASKFIYEKRKKYVFLNAQQEILRPW